MDELKFIIIFYFENLSSTLARVGGLPQSRHFTRFNSTTKGKIARCHQPVIHPWVLEQVFGVGMPYHTNQFGLRKRHWNLETSSVETSSAVNEFLPPYHMMDELKLSHKINVQQQHGTTRGIQIKFKLQN